MQEASSNSRFRHVVVWALGAAVLSRTLLLAGVRCTLQSLQPCTNKPSAARAPIRRCPPVVPTGGRSLHTAICWIAFQCSPAPAQGRHMPATSSRLPLQQQGRLWARAGCLVVSDQPAVPVSHTKRDPHVPSLMLTALQVLQAMSRQAKGINMSETHGSSHLPNHLGCSSLRAARQRYSVCK